MLAHFQDIQNDDILQNGDVIHLLETSLKEDDDDDSFTLDGFSRTFIKIGRHFNIL